MTKIICVVGKKRSGKDTSAGIIQELVPNSKSIAFADSPKNILCNAYQLTRTESKTGIFININHFYGTDNDGNGYNREEAINMTNRDAWTIFNKAISIAISEYRLKHNGISTDDIEKEILASKEAWTIRRFMQIFGTDIVVDKYDKMFWCKLLMNQIIDNLNKDMIIVTDVRQQHEIDFMRTIGATILFIERDTNIVDNHITEQGLKRLENEPLIENNGSLDDLKIKLKEVVYDTIY